MTQHHTQRHDHVIRDVWGSWDQFDQAVRQLVQDAQEQGHTVGGIWFMQKLIDRSAPMTEADRHAVLHAMRIVLEAVEKETIARTGEPSLDVRRLSDGPLPPYPKNQNTEKMERQSRDTVGVASLRHQRAAQEEVKKPPDRVVSKTVMDGARRHEFFHNMRGANK